MKTWKLVEKKVTYKIGYKIVADLYYNEELLFENENSLRCQEYVGNHIKSNEEYREYELTNDNLDAGGYKTGQEYLDTWADLFELFGGTERVSGTKLSI